MSEIVAVDSLLGGIENAQHIRQWKYSILVLATRATPVLYTRRLLLANVVRRGRQLSESKTQVFSAAWCKYLRRYDVQFTHRLTWKIHHVVRT